MATDGAGNRAPGVGSLVEAQVPFYVKESIVPFYNKAGRLLSMGVATANDTPALANEVGGQVGTGTYTFKEGQEFTISIKGVGWTQLDNTLGVDYDNSHLPWPRIPLQRLHGRPPDGHRWTRHPHHRPLPAAVLVIAEPGHLLRHGAPAVE